MRRKLVGLFVAVCVAGLVSGQPKDKGKGKKTRRWQGGDDDLGDF